MGDSKMARLAYACSSRASSGAATSTPSSSPLKSMSILKCGETTALTAAICTIGSNHGRALTFMVVKPCASAACASADQPSGVMSCAHQETGQAFRYLQANGLLIGTNDLWIAATAIVHGMPLVTRNERHFQRVPKLQVLGY